MTQNETVMVLENSSEALSLTLTYAPEPEKESAVPNVPVAHAVLPIRVPVLPFPDASAVAVPAPSLNAQEAAAPCTGAAILSVRLADAVAGPEDPLTVIAYVPAAALAEAESSQGAGASGGTTGRGKSRVTPAGRPLAERRRSGPSRSIVGGDVSVAVSPGINLDRRSGSGDREAEGGRRGAAVRRW